ncbi:MAG: hypothetical protein PHC34_04270 [Candidatus Gastranaerophilales bacterium]|nr:hypothetical protein [Candidatus Gastranaerophilales bacterium]
MKELIKILSVIVLSLFVTNNFVFALTDNEIKERIIQESILNYPGNCPCPYNIARNGSRCGKRSAYSKHGGYSPICYPDQINQKMIDEYKKTHKK